MRSEVLEKHIAYPANAGVGGKIYLNFVAHFYQRLPPYNRMSLDNSGQTWLQSGVRDFLIMDIVIV